MNGKARQAFALAIGFFTLVQTVAFNNFAAAREHGTGKTLIVILRLSR